VSSEEIQFVRASPEHETELARFFQEIAGTDDEVGFHPHDFTSDSAHRICSYQGRDLYVLALAGSTVAGYGMLRGWDEGFEIPSLGLIVRRRCRGKGIGRRLMNHLHDEARAAKAGSVRLTVEPENRFAIDLYRSAGYEFDSLNEQGRIVGHLRIR
jgi:[ribosomal protein S18]-alanine N-acetyltransferase